MKVRIREIFDLRQEFVTISPEEDMLGEWGKGESVAHSFEVRFPSEWYDAHTEGFPEVIKTQRFVELQKWVMSTDTTTATDVLLASPVTYGGVEYTHDTKEYRLAKFREEAKKYFNIDDTIFYYIFTETFLMIDSRVKNAFPSYSEHPSRLPGFLSGSSSDTPETGCPPSKRLLPVQMPRSWPDCRTSRQCRVPQDDSGHPRLQPDTHPPMPDAPGCGFCSQRDRSR